MKGRITATLMLSIVLVIGGLGGTSLALAQKPHAGRRIQAREPCQVAALTAKL